LWENDIKQDLGDPWFWSAFASKEVCFVYFYVCFCLVWEFENRRQIEKNRNIRVMGGLRSTANHSTNAESSENLQKWNAKII
jgi:hypothetical protein